MMVTMMMNKKRSRRRKRMNRTRWRERKKMKILQSMYRLVDENVYFSCKENQYRNLSSEASRTQILSVPKIFPKKKKEKKIIMSLKGDGNFCRVVAVHLFNRTYGETAYDLLLTLLSPGGTYMVHKMPTFLPTPGF